MPLFEVAAVTVASSASTPPTLEKLVFGPKAIVARDGESAKFAAVLDTAWPKDVDINTVRVLVRPFG